MYCKTSEQVFAGTKLQNEGPLYSQTLEVPRVPNGFFFRSKTAIVSGQDFDRGFAAHNCSFATKKPSGT